MQASAKPGGENTMASDVPNSLRSMAELLESEYRAFSGALVNNCPAELPQRQSKRSQYAAVGATLIGDANEQGDPDWHAAHTVMPTSIAGELPAPPCSARC